MDYTSSASAAFRELGGLDIVVERLKQEAEAGAYTRPLFSST